MTYHGTVQNGMVVLHGVTLPDGTPVTVVPSSRTAYEADAKVPQPPTNMGGDLTIGQKLAALGRWAETQPCDLPEDLAENHDHYVHGAPRRS